jgi:hypothetical protein
MISEWRGNANFQFALLPGRYVDAETALEAAKAVAHLFDERTTPHG